MQLRERRQRSCRRERRITTEVPSVGSVGIPSLRSQQQYADTRRQRWQMLTPFAVAGRPYWSGGWQELPRSASLSGVPPSHHTLAARSRRAERAGKIFFPSWSMIVRGFRPSWSGRRGLGVGRGLECGALEVGDGLIRPWFGAVRVVLPGVDVSGLVSKASRAAGFR